MPDQMPDEETEVLREFARTVLACRRIGRLIARVAAFSVPIAAVIYYIVSTWRNLPPVHWIGIH